MSDDDRPKPKPVHEIGQDLSMLSLAEIDQRVAALQAEIERLGEARAKRMPRAAPPTPFSRKSADVPQKG